MPEFIVETNFFVEADDERQAQQKVQDALFGAHHAVSLPNWTVSYVQRWSDMPAMPGFDFPGYSTKVA